MKRNFLARLLTLMVVLSLFAFCFGEVLAEQNVKNVGLDEEEARMEALYGENHEIKDGNYDPALAAKCVNGTFVGKKSGDPSLTAEQSPDGKAKEWPLYDLENKQVMILDEFDIHVEKEAERGILDWDRTYFLTKYYCI